MAQTVMVVDLSHYQAEPDFSAVLAGGVVGLIFKATQGTSYVDDTYKDREKKAIAAGLKTSTYHFFETGNVEKQMDHYLATVQPPTGARVCIDHEPNSNGVSPSRSELEQAVSYLFTKRPDLQVTIYSGHLIKDQLGSARSDILAKTSLWLAQYTTGTPSWPKGTWPTWSLWQFTDSAKVAGFKAPVDGNTFNGSAENLRKWFGPASTVDPAPSPSPAPAEGVVDIDLVVSAPVGVKVVVSINGDVVKTVEGDSHD